MSRRSLSAAQDRRAGRRHRRPAACAGRLGADVRLLLPGFPAIVAGVRRHRPGRRFVAPWGELGAGASSDRRGDAAGIPAYLIDVPDLYARDRQSVLGPDGHDWPDNPNASRCWAPPPRAGRGRRPDDWRPDVVHAHDWHAGLAPAYLACAGPASGPRASSPCTTSPTRASSRPTLSAASACRRGLLDGLEFHGQRLFHEGRPATSPTGITTVSPTYAREIQTPEQGCGLDGLLRARAGALDGILNGVDYDGLEPGHRPLLPPALRRRPPRRQGRCKAALQHELGLAPDARCAAVRAWSAG